MDPVECWDSHQSTNKRNVGSNNPMFGRKHSVETKIKISKALIGIQPKHNPNKSHPHTEEWKIQHSKQMTGKSNPAYGKSLPEERKNKISNSLKGKYIGENSCNWKDGKRISCGGYILITNYNHPNKTKHGDVFEHRLIMEQYLGRYLNEEEIVHHINEDKQDNRIENLMLFNNDSEHHKYHNQRRKKECLC
jgi:hypothetical protein